MTDSLLARVDTVASQIADALAQSGSSRLAESAREVAQRLHDPLRVAIAGRLKAGKSTLLNALAGDVMAPTDASECTKTVTWYTFGQSYGAWAFLPDGARHQLSLIRDPAGTRIELGNLRVADIERVMVTWPSSTLRATTLIDTPGVGSLSGFGSKTVEFLAADDDQAPSADAVVYLAKHVHRDDVAFLEAFHDSDGSRATPVNAVGVLSRADEIGGGRLDSLDSAARIADRARRDPAIRRLCQTFVPVAGLVAQAAVTLTEGEFQALRRLAHADDVDSEWLLLSVDRFAGDDGRTTGLHPDERALLLDRFGIYGLRVAREILRRDESCSARTLSKELRQISGYNELVNVLNVSFAARRDTLKARSGLVALERLVRLEPSDELQRSLHAELEAIHSSAHEIVELGVLLALRRGDVQLDDRFVREAEQVILGHSGAERVGAPGADDATVRAAALEATVRWRELASHPLAPPRQVEVALAIARSFEGIVAGLTGAPDL